MLSFFGKREINLPGVHGSHNSIRCIAIAQEIPIGIDCGCLKGGER